MKEFQIFDKSILKYEPELNFENKKAISYSQLSSYWSCPKKWELMYIKKIKDTRPSIHLLFGTAIHETLQYLIYLYFKTTVKSAESFDIEKFFRERMFQIYTETGEDFSTKEEMYEFYLDGVKIIKYVKKKRNLYFNTKNYELVGIEVPIFHTLKKTNGNEIVFLGYIDLILKDKRDGQYILFDIKTSTSGWNAYKKKDSLTTSQLVLYKIFFSEQYNVPVEKIHVQYFIVKRKLNENSEWPQKRIQDFTPSAGSVTMNKVNKNLRNFLDFSFDDNGNYDENKKYLALSGSYGSNCRFCLFNDKEDLCPKKNRM